MRMKCVLVLDMQSAQGGGSLRARVCVRACVGGWEGGRRAREQKRGETPMAESTTTLHAKPRTKVEAQQQRRQRRGDVELGEEHVEAQRRRLEQRHALLLREELGGRGEDAGLQLLVDCNCAQGRRSLRGEAVPSRLEAAQGDRGQGRV